MSNTATINRGGDLLSLTAQRGGTLLVSLHSVNPAAHLTGLSVPGAQLRAALDEVAPAGSYTRTDEQPRPALDAFNTEQRARAERERLGRLVQDVADGDGHTAQVYGVKLAQCDTYGKTAEERHLEKVEQERDVLAERVGDFADSIREQQKMIDRLRAEQPRPLSPDAITDEMVERGARQYVEEEYISWRRAPETVKNNARESVRGILRAALTEPTRPEGAEEIEALIETSPWHLAGSCASEADWLAERGVRVVTEEKP